jgi:hypothetical protein
VPQRYCDDLRSGVTHTETTKPPNPQVGDHAGAKRGEAPRQPAYLIITTKIATESAKRNANTGLSSTPAAIIDHCPETCAPYAPAVWISGATLGGDD